MSSSSMNSTKGRISGKKNETFKVDADFSKKIESQRITPVCYFKCMKGLKERLRIYTYQIQYTSGQMVVRS